MSKKTLKPFTQQKRLDLYNELVKLLDTNDLQAHARGSEIIARLAYDDGFLRVRSRKPKKGAKDENKKPEVTDS